MLAQPFYRLTTLGFVLASIGFLALMCGGWVSKEMLLDLGTVFRVVVAFAIATFETGMPIGADHPVRGISGVAPWLVATGILLPNSPLKAGAAALGSVLAWPLAFGDPRVSGPPRCLVWVRPDRAERQRSTV